MPICVFAPLRLSLSARRAYGDGGAGGVLVGPSVGVGRVTTGVGERPNSKTAGAKARPTGVGPGGGAGGVWVRKGVGARPSSKTTGAKERAAGVVVGVAVSLGGGGGGGVCVASGPAAESDSAADNWASSKSNNTSATTARKTKSRGFGFMSGSFATGLIPLLNRGDAVVSGGLTQDQCSMARRGSIWAFLSGFFRCWAGKKLTPRRQDAKKRHLFSWRPGVLALNSTLCCVRPTRPAWP